jgi:hypothetical protein
MGLASPETIASDPVASILLGIVVARKIELFADAEDIAYRLNPRSLERPLHVFAQWESVKTGRLIICPSAFSHRSIEAEMEGRPLFAK